MRTRTVRGLGGDLANSARAHRPLVDDHRQVVLRGAGKHVAVIDQGESSSVRTTPRRLHLGSVKLSVRLAAQAFGRGSGRRLKNAPEDHSFSWYDGRHSTDYGCARIGSASPL